jgi:hypothetical protein
LVGTWGLAHSVTCSQSKSSILFGVFPFLSSPILPISVQSYFAILFPPLSGVFLVGMDNAENIACEFIARLFR